MYKIDDFMRFLDEYVERFLAEERTSKREEETLKVFVDAFKGDLYKATRPSLNFWNGRRK